MSSSDNITALAENKVLILYTLSQIPNGLSNDGLYKIISSINDVNYFYFKEVLTDLLDSKLVGMFTKDEEDESVLKITSEGKNALSLTIDVLPGILKLKADNVFQKEFSSIEKAFGMSYMKLYSKVKKTKSLSFDKIEEAVNNVYGEERNVKNYYDLIKENYFSRKNELFIPTTEETLEELLSS